ncbi:MAG: PD-(D/E)XK nuclease family protein, partial [Proteobacteria bacterium]|nr:PD-(D/E)XK nuclease family protein [Pseudomonadota bacterium]
DAPPERDETLELFSAPNELMECVEIARRAQRLADSGIAFDRMAVLLRQPEAYQPLMEEALRRAGIPAYFEEGVARPHDAGRAFLALLRCAGEGCSAARFAEYLSLAQVPKLDDAGRPVRQRLDRVALTDEVAGSLLREEAEAEESAPGPSLQAPSRWEQLLVDAAVIGGVDRWERRLRGLEHELEARVKAAPDDTTRARIEREMRQLRVLAGYSTPLIKLLAALPGEARWGAWLGALRELAETALRDPESVVAVLEELEPMADVGPAGLEEVYSVLEDRLRTLRREPARRRYGQLFVGAIESGRGRAFDVVFVPGLAEGVFPKRSSEDPLLLDTYRAKLKAGLTVQDDRVARERLLLRTAAAAGDRLVVSFPRVDSGQNRPRVPSFYALEILRAAEGGLPDLKQFQKRASDACPLRLGWPAPRDARVAVDDQEYDLAVLDAAFRTSKRGAVGVAHYLVKSNEHLGRTMRGRWKRWESPKWAAEDGLVSTAAEVRKLLAGHRLHARPYSATTLERYAACPYRFYLHGVYGLAPRKEAVALEQMDPLTRGAIFHDLLHRIVVALRGEERLPLGRARYEDALKVADRVVDEARGGWEEQLAPAISRVWQSEWDDLKFDLRGWVRYACLVGCDWEPVESEYGFGDPPLTLFNGRLKLRGRVDLIERGADGAHRIIDLKTGKKPQNPPTFVGGGASLQPVLYSIAVEADRQVKVEAGRLFYCTHRGGYEHAEVEINGAARAIAEDVITVIDEAIEDGFLPAAPAHEACERCDYRLLCGPYEEQRVRVKSREPLKPLRWLREQP